MFGPAGTVGTPLLSVTIAVHFSARNSGLDHSTLIVILLSALSHAHGLLEDITIATSLLVCRRKLKAHLF